MKRFMLTVAFTCFLSVSVLAGEMPTCGILSTSSTPVGGTTPQTGEALDTSTACGDMSELLTTVVLEIITWP